MFACLTVSVLLLLFVLMCQRYAHTVCTALVVVLSKTICFVWQFGNNCYGGLLLPLWMLFCWLRTVNRLRMARASQLTDCGRASRLHGVPCH